jgi:hypothetical protein
VKSLKTESVTRASTDQEGQARTLAPASSRSGAARCDHRPLQPRDPHQRPPVRLRCRPPRAQPRLRPRPAPDPASGRARTSAARGGRPARARRRRATGEASRRRASSEVAHTTNTANTTTTPTTTHPDRATRLPLPHHHDLPRPPRAPPLTALRSSTSFSSSCSTRPHSACRRPASGPPATCLGCPKDLSGRSRKGGPARSGGPPFLESPGVKPTLGRRRGGGPVIS